MTAEAKSVVQSCWTTGGAAGTPAPYLSQFSAWMGYEKPPHVPLPNRMMPISVCKQLGIGCITGFNREI